MMARGKKGRLVAYAQTKDTFCAPAPPLGQEPAAAEHYTDPAFPPEPQKRMLF